MVKEKTVSRDLIHVGEVAYVCQNGIGQYPANYLPIHPWDRVKANEYYINCWQSYRSMLFIPTEQGLAHDLLYRSPNYPVLNMCAPAACNDLSILIKDAYNLGALLQYFGYEEQLTLQDIQSIRERFFTGRFGMDNCGLFGMKEYIPDHFKAYQDGVEVMDPNKRYELYKESLSLGSERQFGDLPTTILPRELMDILDERGRNSSRCGFYDAFEPSEKEGKIMVYR